MFRHIDRTTKGLCLDSQIHYDGTSRCMVSFRHIPDCLIVYISIRNGIDHLLPDRFNTGMGHNRDSDPLVTIL